MDNVGTKLLSHGINTRLISPNNDSTKQEFCGLDDKPRNILPCWNTPGAKPKDKMFYGDWLTGRAQCPEICDATGWPALSSDKNIYQDLASSSSMNKERYESKSKSKKPQRELMTGPKHWRKKTSILFYQWYGFRRLRKNSGYHC